MKAQPSERRRILIVAGEASGDLHGSHLVRSLYRRDPHLEIAGVGGKALKEAGLKVIFDVAELSGMGLTELAGSLMAICRAYRTLSRALREQRPRLVVLIDFPDFNLRLARLARKLGIPVLYYISPQVWAWRRRRTEKIARLVDHIAVVFPFEVPLYQQAGARVSFVGHPLLDVVRAIPDREATLRGCGLDPDKLTLALLPGSRRREVASLLPPMLEAAAELRRRVDAQFVLIRASTVARSDLEDLLRRSQVPVFIVEQDPYNVLQAADFAWVASGTATLEIALLERPMVIMYRLAQLSYVLARLLVRVDHIGMVNIVAGEAVVPELIQGEVTGKRISEETMKILSDPALRQRITEKLREVRRRLGSPGAADRVADIALNMMGGLK